MKADRVPSRVAAAAKAREARRRNAAKEAAFNKKTPS